MIKRGIFGGTFDPIHWGHLRIAQAALLTHQLKEVIWIPQLFPPHKIPTATINQRWSMVELAIASYPHFYLPATLEQWQNNLSGNLAKHQDYAIDTFYLLQKLYPATQWFWILGIDSFLTLSRWKSREILVPACNWLVAARNLPNRNQEQLQQVTLELRSQGIEITWELLPMEAIDISSSQIRQTSIVNQSLDQFLPFSVQQYIIQHHLYSDQKSLSST